MFFLSDVGPKMWEEYEDSTIKFCGYHQAWVMTLLADFSWEQNMPKLMDNPQSMVSVESNPP